MRGLGRPRLLVFGGSQGAGALNEGDAGWCLPELLAAGAGARRCCTRRGRGMPTQRERRTWRRERMRGAVAGGGVSGRHAGAICGSEPDDLCRSGASSVAELAAAGQGRRCWCRFRLATDDHQRKNAEAFCAGGRGSDVLLEGEMTAGAAAGGSWWRCLRDEDGTLATMARAGAGAGAARGCARADWGDGGGSWRGEFDGEMAC